ncbi:MAG: hypothetical protein HON98_07450 [Chloroflexi bacterium]|jgi:plastocyanin|nr:hypothetical protein [Chloroflexota bacterium]MBT3669778.1 hypothetical protein [Chloroflexota bacterium]MBT4002257.1 hypothetical protein [Chloroflexota bacterium]MBT4305258.1 hypothetical protein [Chloroflexota bacterium]MBT4534819.1 hypothetical protein [Chloroflexota bacterium]
MKKRFSFLAMILLIFILSACSTDKAAPEPVEITIEMSEYAFSPAELEFEVGQEVTLHLVNVGTLDHEIMFGRDVKMTDSRPNGYQIDLFEEAGLEPVVLMMEDEHAEGEEGMEMEEEHMEHTGFMVMVPPNSTEHTISFTVTEEMVGTWEIGCFELNGVHYDSGMFGTLVITN